MVKRVTPKPPRKRLPPGSVVNVDVGGSKVRATVLEDLGPILADGRHLVRLRGKLRGDSELSDFDLSLHV